MSNSLFDRADVWCTTPLDAAISWLASADYAATSMAMPGEHRRQLPAALSASSQRVYAAMLSNYFRFCAQARVTVLEASRPHIARFLASVRAESAIRTRYVRLLERLYQFLSNRGLVAADPTRGVIAELRKRPGVDEPMCSLTSAQEHSLVLIANDLVDRGPQERRAALMLALLMGSGPTVGELRAACWSDIRLVNGGLVLDVRARPSRRRTVPILPPWESVVRAVWQDFMHSDSPIFISNKRMVMDDATVHRTVASALEPLGLRKPCARSLRNSFAMRVLSEQGDAAAQTLLGNQTARAMRRYVHALRGAVI